MTVTMVATPGGLSNFVGWGGDCAASTETSCELSVAGTKSVTARFAPLSDAMTRSLDLEGAVWTNGGESAWFAQEHVTHDGIAAAQSGAIGDNQTSQLSTTLTGPGYLSFWWKVSSEAGWDYLRFYLDEVEQGASTGDTDWTQISLYLPAGSHTLTWVYEKDASDAGGEDAGWVDQLVFDNANRTLIIDPPTGGIISGGSAGTYPPGTRLTLTATADSDHYFAGWGGDCAGTGQAESCELTLNSDKRVSASFLPLLTGATTDVAVGYEHIAEAPHGLNVAWRCRVHLDELALLLDDDHLLEPAPGIRVGPSTPLMQDVSHHPREPQNAEHDHHGQTNQRHHLPWVSSGSGGGRSRRHGRWGGRGKGCRGR